jgi:hypothetical protein
LLTSFKPILLPDVVEKVLLLFAPLKLPLSLPIFPPLLLP